MDYVVDWDKVYACCLSMTCMDNFCKILFMTSQAMPIRKADFNEKVIAELVENKLLLQSGSSIRLPKEIFHFI